MSWTFALVVSLTSALITATVTAFVADHVTKEIGVSDREGGRGMAIAFIFIPAGLIGGALFGLLGTKLVHATEWAHFWKASGLSLAMANGTVLAIGGAFLLGIPRPPLLDGESLGLEAEILLPKDLRPKEPTNEQNPRASLYAGPKDNQYMEVDTSRVRTEGDTLIVPVNVTLESVSSGRMLSITIDDKDKYTLDMPLQPLPKEKDLAWTAPMPMRFSELTSPEYEYTRVLVRYRVVKKGKPERD